MINLNNLFNCPITLKTLSSPHTTPCGHTFDYPSICQALEYKQKCPIDRNPLTIEKLIPNHLAREIIEQRMMIVFLDALDKRFTYECNISRRPLFDAVKLPCGHMFGYFGIREWYKTNKSCPFDNKEFDLSELVYDSTTCQLARDHYPAYLDEVKKYNDTLISKASESNLNDDFILKCPLSDKKFENPVIAPCGHTFDSASIADDSTCPRDGMKLNKDEMIPNRIIMDYIECLSSQLLSTDRKGIFLALKSDTTLDKIREIALTLGIIYPEEKISKLVVDGYAYHDFHLQLSQIKSKRDIPNLYLL